MDRVHARAPHIAPMSAASFLEKLEAKRVEHLNSLAQVPDGDTHKHTRIKGHMAGLQEAAQIFRQENKNDDEEK